MNVYDALLTALIAANVATNIICYIALRDLVRMIRSDAARGLRQNAGFATRAPAIYDK